jgi:antirestriction protein ArdC
MQKLLAAALVLSWFWVVAIVLTIYDLQITDEPRADHAQYLASWLAVLKAYKKAIFTAASKASEAATFLEAMHARNRK